MGFHGEERVGGLALKKESCIQLLSGFHHSLVALVIVNCSDNSQPLDLFVSMDCMFYWVSDLYLTRYRVVSSVIKGT